jgi:O-antigen ligase
MTMPPPRRSVFSAAWAWFWATIDDPNRAAYLALPALAFLPLALGSVATFFYFGAVIYIGLIWLGSRLKWVWPPTTAFGCIVSLAYFAVTIVSPLLFPDKLDGLRDVGTAFHFLVLPMIVGILVQTPKVDTFDLYLNAIRAAAIVALAHALVQIFVLGHPRATAGMANAIPYGDTAILTAGLSMVGFSRLSRRMKVFALTAAMSGIAGCLLSQTRGALLALPLMAVVAGAHLWPIVRRRTGRAIIAAAAIVAVAGLFGTVAKIPARFEALRASVETPEPARWHDPATAHRVVLWTYGLEAFIQRPMLGYGSQNAVDEVRERAAIGGFELPPYRHLHNEFITTAVGRGLLGLMVLLLLLAAPVIMAVGSPRDERYHDRVAFGVMLSGGYALFGLTNLLFSHDQMNTVFATAYFVLVVACHQAAVGLVKFERPFLGVPPKA